jgi:hypothetical protein
MINDALERALLDKGYCPTESIGQGKWVRVLTDGGILRLSFDHNQAPLIYFIPPTGTSRTHTVWRSMTTGEIKVYDYQKKRFVQDIDADDMKDVNEMLLLCLLMGEYENLDL